MDHLLGNHTDSVAVDSRVCDPSVRRFNRRWWLNGVLSLRCGLEFVGARKKVFFWMVNTWCVRVRMGVHKDVVHKVWWTLACKKGVSRGRLRHEVVGVQLRAGRDFRRCANDGNSVKNPNVIRSVFVRFPPCTGCCARCGRTNVRVCIYALNLVTVPTV